MSYISKDNTPVFHHLPIVDCLLRHSEECRYLHNQYGGSKSTWSVDEALLMQAAEIVEKALNERIRNNINNSARK